MRIKAMEFEKDYQKSRLVCKLTEQELNNLLEKSYNEGYKDGYKDAVTTKLPFKDKDSWEVSYVYPTTTLINNDIGHGTITSISSKEPDPNLKVVGSKEEKENE